MHSFLRVTGFSASSQARSGCVERRNGTEAGEVFQSLDFPSRHGRNQNPQAALTGGRRECGEVVQRTMCSASLCVLLLMDWIGLRICLGHGLMHMFESVVR